MSSSFKIGDWVRVKSNFWGKDVVGKVFQITGKRPDFSFQQAAWTCNKMPYWIEERFLEPMSQKILIMQDEKNPKTVIARNLLTNKKAEAKCAPADEFDFATGAQLALDRLLNKEHSFKKKEKPQYYNGKVVCVEYDGGLSEFFTVGKVYTVKDGVIMSNTGNPNGYNPTDKVKTLNDLNGLHSLHNWFFPDKRIVLRFIEYKGEA